MGSQYSFMSDKTIIDKLQGTSLLFSDFCGSVKQNCCQENKSLFRKLLDKKYPMDCDDETMEAIVHLWCVNCVSVSNWLKLNRSLKNQLIQDFLNTLYCTSHAFDEVFMLLFTNAKSRFILGLSDRTILPSDDLHYIVEDVLRYSSSAGLKYYAYNNDKRCEESIVDFPLKTFSLCPCTRRPLYVAMYLGRPDVVQLLLKYGARIPYEDTCNCMEDSRHPLKNVMDVLKTSFERNTEAVATKASTIRTSRNILSLKLILVDLNHCSPLWQNVLTVVKELNTGADTDAETSSNIPSLKHICRARIRNMMRGNPFLSHPHVWNMLCLPQTLISYMNLDYCKTFSQD